MYIRHFEFSLKRLSSVPRTMGPIPFETVRREVPALKTHESRTTTCQTGMLSSAFKKLVEHAAAEEGPLSVAKPRMPYLKRAPRETARCTSKYSCTGGALFSRQNCPSQDLPVSSGERRRYNRL